MKFPFAFTIMNYDPKKRQQNFLPLTELNKKEINL